MVALGFGALAPVLVGGLRGGAGSRASAQPSAQEVTPQTDASVPAGDVTMIGATPEEPGAPGANETWGVGKEHSSQGVESTAIVRYTSEGGWTLGPGLQNAAGEPLSGFTLEPSPLAGQMTPRGAGVLAGTVSAAGSASSSEAVLVRTPGGAFRETPPVPGEGETLKAGEEPLLKKGEALLGASRTPLIAPLDEGGGQAGALLVPVVLHEGVESRVLHWDGKRWAPEAIEIPKASREDFRVLAIAASSPSNAWLLGQLSSAGSYPKGSLALFHRVASAEPSGWRWEPVELTAGSSEPEPLALTVPVRGSLGVTYVPFTVAGTGEPPTATAQILTVTSEGVWIDGERGDVSASTTMFFKPEGASRGKVEGSWCQPPSGGAPACERELPEALPSGPGRSIAWANGTRFGERVITGMPEGVTLRLEGESFTSVLSLGAGEHAQEDPGAASGAAFSNPHEGWLGMGGLPVHLTVRPAASGLVSWPVSFRHPLLAIAPQPGAPVASFASEALAVGDLGAVARFKPGVGWLPESLFGPGERVRTPRLRAVAWPTPSRAYAVGDESTEGGGEQMWLWRGETGLWEPDPATPLNFRGNLLGVAFDPSNPARGYAVGSGAVAGSGGVLLRYGKTWTQETDLPPQVQNANFTAIAFAGSQAIVAYGTRPSIFKNNATGGLLINDGSGWRVDQEAAALIGTGVPGALAALPDGGAAFTVNGSGGGTRVYERETAGSPWQLTPTPLPSEFAGSLALFREGEGLRAIVANAGGVGEQPEPQVPPRGFPPNFLPALSLGGQARPGGDLLRQTSTGWSDEDHELNPIGEPRGHYSSYDLPSRPDAVQAVLIDPTGTQGWAVGGNINGQDERLETADIERYPADGVTPLGASVSQVPLNSREVTFAIGGGAQCAAPCAERYRTGVGPNVWLQTTLAHASQTGARAFLYTGPHVTKGERNGLSTEAIPFARELASYASILASAPIPTYAALSPEDLDARPEINGAEATFERAFAGFPAPFGQAQAAAGLPVAPEGWLEGEQREACAAKVGCEAGYYAFDSEGASGTVRVIVLDDSVGVDESQLTWLARQLSGAAASGVPAIVLGNADLNAQIQAGDTQAANVARVLGGAPACASAYFYDSPEQNVTAPLQGVSCGSRPIPTFGSGTLGYVNVINEGFGSFHGASGFLLGEVAVSAREASTNLAPVSVRLIPNIGELALEAKDGILLRRSEPALFAGLARRPRAGGRSSTSEQTSEVDPYIPIPENCVGVACANGLFPEYTFSSSDEEVGQFVKPNLASTSSHAVLQGPDGKPIPDPQSGLFCTYNPGTTVVTISAGGLSSSLPVTVQAGSVRQPCGTVPFKHRTAASQSPSAPVPPPAPAPAPAGAAPASSPPLVPVPPLPPAPVTPPPSRPTPTPPVPFFIPPALTTPVLAFVPPPVPTPARPTPPSGTSAVTSPVEMAEHEEEEEEATESVSNQALAYHTSEHEPSPVYILGVVLLAAFAGASIRGRPRRGRREVRVAPATLSGMRSQRRMSSRGRSGGK